ncbi:MAG: Hsp33 family molecular chaperone HslO, partial [Proteobacteria bacterium]|nr:Hsp33 family molecular chaperone HslO [Pseudomonadota bacterium]
MTQKIKIPDTALPSDLVSDLVLPFQLDGANARGRIARFDTTLNTIIDLHDYPPAVLMLLAEAVMLSALIGQTIKLRWKLSLQIRGDGPIRLIATDYFAPSTADGAAKIRAYASFDKDRMPEKTNGNAKDETLEASFKKIGQGAFAILIDQGQGMTPFKGITPLSGASLSSCAETYFHQSEQLPSRFVVKIGTPKKATSPSWSVAGMMVQHLAANSADTTDAVQKSEDWQRTLAHLNTLKSAELLDKTLPHETLLYRLFHQE